LRQQQYEYYRDLLLNFPKPEVAAWHERYVDRNSQKADRG
jgi:hypothetical protein